MTVSEWLYTKEQLYAIMKVCEEQHVDLYIIPSSIPVLDRNDPLVKKYLGTSTCIIDK